MTSRAEVEGFRKALAGLSDRAQKDVEKVFRTLDLKDAIGTRDALLEFLPDIVTAYGESAASVAADYYEGLRAGSGVDSVYTPPLASAAPVEQASASTRWAISNLFGPVDLIDAASVLGNLHKVTDRLVKQPGRETLAGAIGGDPDKPRFARIPTGPVTCRFCATLASRGAVYLSEETAGGLTDFHDHCDCAVTPIFAGMPLPQGYDPAHYRRLYQDNGGASQDFRKGNKTSRAPELRTAPSAPPSKRGLDKTPDLPTPDDGPFAGLPRATDEDLLASAEKVNPFYRSSSDYRVNCQSCTAATEMRARGFDVEAVPNVRDRRGNSLNSAFRYDDGILDHWRRADGSRPTWKTLATTKVRSEAKRNEFLQRELLDEIESWPPGARGAMIVSWKTGGRHIFNVERRADGSIRWIDGQPLGMDQGTGIAPWMDRVSWTGSQGPNRVMRLDDLEPNDSLSDLIRPLGRSDSAEEALLREKAVQVREQAKTRERIVRLNSEFTEEWMKRDGASSPDVRAKHDRRMKEIEAELDRLSAMLS